MERVFIVGVGGGHVGVAPADTMECQEIVECVMVAMLSNPMRIGPAKSGEERRIFPRKDATGQLESHRLDNSIEARQFPRMTLYLRDVSFGGLSAISPTPLAEGERLAVFFPGEGNRGGWDAEGRVIRCDQSSMGYRIAMEFDPLLAA